jgi:histidinol-phosphatase (PHP family)
MPKTNFHTHTVWCDGSDTAEAMVLSAIEKGFCAIGFSSHMAFPEACHWQLKPERAAEYVAEIRALREKYASEIEVFCGGEADYIQGATTPEKSRYAAMGLDYLIGSLHTVVAPGGGRVSVDSSPELLSEGIAKSFGGDARRFVCAYFEQQREMLKFDFDVLAHPDLVRKFNVRNPYFDETAPWYLSQLEESADAIAAAGKIVEVNTGAISRGWLDDAYPSPAFRAMLRERGVRFVLSSDSHAAASIDCRFDRFAGAEEFVDLREEILSCSFGQAPSRHYANVSAWDVSGR